MSTFVRAVAALGLVIIAIGALFLGPDPIIQPGKLVTAPTSCGDSPVGLARHGVPSPLPDAEPGAEIIDGPPALVNQVREECRRTAIRRLVISGTVMGFGVGVVVTSIVVGLFGARAERALDT